MNEIKRGRKPSQCKKVLLGISFYIHPAFKNHAILNELRALPEYKKGVSLIKKAIALTENSQNGAEIKNKWHVEVE